MNIKFFAFKLRTANPAVADLPKSLVDLHNNPADNIFHDLETPAHKELGANKPHTVEYTGDSLRGAKFHRNELGKRTGVVKGDANSFLKEPLVHHIGEHIQPGLYPKTVIRNHDNGNGVLTPHSFQEHFPGEVAADLSSSKARADLAFHPHHAAIRAMDWAMQNHDRRSSNLMFNEHHPDDSKQVGGIDNGGAFDYQYPFGDIALNMMQNAKGNFSPEFRQGVLNHDPKHISGLFDRVKGHKAHETAPDWIGDVEEGERPDNGFLSGNARRITPDVAKQQFLRRMNMLKEAFNQTGPNVVNNTTQLNKFIKSHPEYEKMMYEAEMRRRSK